MEIGIFICYRRREAAALAGRAYDALANWFPGKVFMDVESIAPGLDFRERLRMVMEQCQVVVALIGPEWAKELNSGQRRVAGDDYVRSELEQALAAGLTVIPVLLDGAHMPAMSDLPQELHRLQFQQALEVRTHCFARDIAPLRLAVCKALGLAAPTLWEEFISRMPGMKTVDERTRNTMARVSIYTSGLGSLALLYPGTYSLSFVLSFLSIWSALVGVNSRRLRLLAYTGVLLAVSNLGGLGWLVLRNVE